MVLKNSTCRLVCSPTYLCLKAKILFLKTYLHSETSLRTCGAQLWLKNNIKNAFDEKTLLVMFLCTFFFRYGIELFK